VAYWDCGGRGVESFTINFTQDVTPIYLNNIYVMPTYFRVGNFSINASIVSYDNLDISVNKSTIYNADYEDLKHYNGKDGISITLKIGKKAITFINTVVISKSFSHPGS
jgi:hypothetical protein